MNNDADESLLLLDMLGLIPPRPGNEPKEIRRREGTKAERSEQNKREFAERRQVKKAKLEKNGYRPEEYGEVD